MNKVPSRRCFIALARSVGCIRHNSRHVTCLRRHHSTRGGGPLKEALEEVNTTRRRKQEKKQAHKTRQMTSSVKVPMWNSAAAGAAAGAKFGAYFYTGSASMLSEAIHSGVDALNQLFFMWGTIYSHKNPHPGHPYGFDKSRYLWPLISGLSIFPMGAAITINHGYTQLTNPSLILDNSMLVAYGVLSATAAFKGLTLAYNYQEARKQAKLEGVTLYHYRFKGHEPHTMFVEDVFGAVGIGIAGAGIGLSVYTGNPIFDALGSIGVGTLLASRAVFIVVTKKDALIGRAMDRAKQLSIVELLESENSVFYVSDVKTIVEGPSYVRFKAEIYFDTDFITQSYLSDLDTSSLLKEVRGLQGKEEYEEFIKLFATHMVNALAREVDRLEGLIKMNYPEIQHIDLEAL